MEWFTTFLQLFIRFENWNSADTILSVSCIAFLLDGKSNIGIFSLCSRSGNFTNNFKYFWCFGYTVLWHIIYHHILSRHRFYLSLSIVSWPKSMPKNRTEPQNYEQISQHVLSYRLPPLNYVTAPHLIILLPPTNFCLILFGNLLSFCVVILADIHVPQRKSRETKTCIKIRKQRQTE